MPSVSIHTTKQASNVPFSPRHCTLDFTTPVLISLSPPHNFIEGRDASLDPDLELAVFEKGEPHARFLLPSGSDAYSATQFLVVSAIRSAAFGRMSRSVHYRFVIRTDE
jgi:hypothetical protein